MKKLSYLLLLFVALAIGNQLKAQCNPYFSNTADSTNGVMFNVYNPQSSSIYTYRWNFGDGSPIDSGVSVYHQYGNSGAYAVTLYVDSFGVQCGSRHDTIYVNYCGANFLTQIGANGIVSFTSQAYHAPYGTVYSWDFGDGNGSVLKNPTHTYNNAGVYSVTHTVIDTFHQVSCSYVDSFYVAGGSQNCNASFYMVKDSTTNFGVILYNNSSNESSHLYSWDFGDGQSGTGRTPTHFYQNFGTYVVCLTITDSIYNCNITFCDTVGMDSLGNVNKTTGFSLEVRNEVIASIEEKEMHKLEKISIYPNPATSEVTIDLSDVDQSVNIQLSDLSGKMILSESNIQSKTMKHLDISELGDGLYFLSIENGNQRRVEKIIKLK